MRAIALNSVLFFDSVGIGDEVCAAFANAHSYRDVGARAYRKAIIQPFPRLKAEIAELNSFFAKPHAVLSQVMAKHRSGRCPARIQRPNYKAILQRCLRVTAKIADLNSRF